MTTASAGSSVERGGIGEAGRSPGVAPGRHRRDHARPHEQRSGQRRCGGNGSPAPLGQRRQREQHEEGGAVGEQLVREVRREPWEQQQGIAGDDERRAREEEAGAPARPAAPDAGDEQPHRENGRNRQPDEAQPVGPAVLERPDVRHEPERLAGLPAGELLLERRREPARVDEAGQAAHEREQRRGREDDRGGEEAGSAAGHRARVAGLPRARDHHRREESREERGEAEPVRADRARGEQAGEVERAPGCFAAEPEPEQHGRREGESAADDLLLPREVAREEQRGVERERRAGRQGQPPRPAEGGARGRIRRERQEREQRRRKRAVGVGDVGARQPAEQAGSEGHRRGPVLGAGALVREPIGVLGHGLGCGPLEVRAALGDPVIGVRALVEARHLPVAAGERRRAYERDRADRERRRHRARAQHPDDPAPEHDGNRQPGPERDECDRLRRDTERKQCAGSGDPGGTGERRERGARVGRQVGREQRDEAAPDERDERQRRERQQQQREVRHACADDGA